MDNTNIIAEQIEAYLKEKSDESKIEQSLKADPSEIDYYNFGGDGGYLRKNICKITVNHSDSGTNDPCSNKEDPYGANQTWKCGKSDVKGNDENKSICISPRRQHMCINNLEKLDVDRIRDNNAFLADVLLTARNEGERIVQNHPDTNSSNVCVALERSFADLADIIRGTDQRKGANKLEPYLKDMFKKIRGNDRIPQDKYPKNDQNYRKLREDWWNANRQQVWEVITCSARSNDLLIKRGWTTSKEFDGENKLELCRKCGHYEEKVPTQLDYIPQLLRWLTEWIEDFYREKQKLIDDMEKHSEECTKKDGESQEVTSYCSICKEKCTKYCEFVKKRKFEWGNQENKYKELYQENKSSKAKKKSTYDDYVNEFFKNLEANYSSLDDYIKNDPYSKEYATKLSVILNSLDGNNAYETPLKHKDEAYKCNESEIASVEKSISDPSSENACIIHSSKKPNKKKECKDVKLGINKNDKDLKICVIEDDFLSGVENCCCFKDLLGILQEFCSDKNQCSTLPNGSCDNKNQDECQEKLEKVLEYLQNGCKCKKCKSRPSTSNNKWIWKKYSGNEGGLQDEYANTIGLPPRTQSLYLGNLPKLENVCEGVTDINFDTKEKFLAGFLIAAFHEGKNLKNSSQKKNVDKEKKLWKALKYSFADYADLIKGTSIWDNDFTKNLELNLQKTFGKLFRKYIKRNIGTEQNTLYSSVAELRESWWNTNKKYIWLAMKHGAGMNNTTCNGGNSGDNGSSCDDMPTIDLIPQYLRFLQEWVENFCKQREEKVKPVIENCKSYKDISDKTKIDEKCKTECKSKCEEYKNFIEVTGDSRPTGIAGSPWSKRWDQIYKRYSKHIEDAKRNLEAGTESCAASTDENKCIQSDIDSFFKHLVDIGLTTPSSYLSVVLDDKICGNDNAPWTTYTTYTTTENCDKQKDKAKPQQSDTTVVVNVPSPLGNTPYGYKYACQCRRPSTQESCDDRNEYMNQWSCDSTKNPKHGSRKDDYESCKYNGVKVTTSIKKLKNSKLNENDVIFINLFEQWNKEIQYQIEQYMTNTKISCNNEKNVLSTSTKESAQQNGNGHENDRKDGNDHIKNYNEKCECYKLWMDKINEQWKTQKKNYNKFERKQINDGNNGPQKKEMVKLSNFLFFSCWEEYIQKQFNGDWSKIKNIGSDTFDFLIKKCGNKSTDGEKIFSGKLKNAQQQYKETQNTDTNNNPSVISSDCKGINYIRGCQSKTYDGFMSPGKGGEKKWICKDTITHGDINGVCIPPRTQNLCVGELWDKSYGGRSNIKNYTKESLKGKLKSAIKKETELLYEYHDTGTAIISRNPMKEEEERKGDGQVEGEGEKEGEDGDANSNNSNEWPKGFCHAVQRSFIDYKNMILGTSVNTYEHIGKLQEDIKKIIEQGTTQRSGKPVGGADKVNEWWKGIEKEMWDGVKCAITKIKKQNNNGEFNGNECGISPPTGNDADQFVSWFKEWGEQFCIERLQYEKDIREACTNNCQGKEMQGDCKRNCEKYKKYIAEKKEEWDKQKAKYENKYVGKSASDLLKENYPECISANFDFIFNDNAEYKTYYPYGDYSSICSCEEVKYYKYKNYEGKNNKSLCREKVNDSSWSKKYIKKLENGRTLEGVYVPPRRQRLCLYELFPIIIKYKNDITNVKKELLETLQIVAEREAYYLWKEYHENSDTPNLAHKKACCAIRASFYDLGDIIKGNDLVHDEYTKYIDMTLNEIFRGSSNKNDIDTKRARSDWWENETIKFDNVNDHKTIRQLVWYAMQYGVRYAIKEENERKKQTNKQTQQSGKDSDNLPLCMVVEHIGIAKPQFIRWLEEWTNEFCEEYTKYFEDMKSKCDDKKGAEDCGDNSNIGCKKACANYTNWLNPKRIEWNGMSNYYNKIYRKSNKESEDGEDYSMIMAPTVIQYLNKRCYGEINGNYICCSCKNIGENYNTSSTQTIKVQKKKDESCEEEKGPLDAINEVLSKMDKKYRNYKINCTEVYLEHIEEQLKEIENAINDYKLYPIDRCFDDKSKMKVCDLIGDAIGCKNKTNLEELDDWNDMDLPEPYNKYKGVLIPPRRRQLCFSRIVRDPGNLRNLKVFKEEILKGALSEGKFLGNYYEKAKDKEKYDDRKENGLEAMKNSFYDYEDIIKGSDMLGNIQFKDIKRKLETLLKKETNGDTIEADDWWKANNKSIWNAMLCGYKKSGNKMLDPSWCTISTAEKPTQFLRWIKEWGTNVCIQKEKYKQNVKSKCYDVTNIDSDQQELQSKSCIQEITKYQEWSRKRSVQWKAISERYNKDKGKKEFNNVNQPDANAYLKEHCSKCLCGYNDMKEITKYANIGNEEFKQIKENVKIPAELEDVIYRLKHYKYDNDNNYICNKYKNIHERMKKSNGNFVTDNFVKKSWEINNDVLLPPRRKNLLLKIDKSDICKYKKNPEMFKDFIYSSGFTEVERLKKAYGGAKAKVVHAMKYSFGDIGSIIKGDDMMDKNRSDDIRKILGDVKAKNDNRKKWWDENKYYIWESMLCAYKNAYGNISDVDNKIREIPNNDNVNKFLRWFTEWAEDFCHHQEEEIKKLEKQCKFKKCDDADNNEKKQCHQACWNYKAFLEKWKKQYKKQNIEFEGLTYTDSVIKDKSAPDYLKENCQDKCSCIKDADSTHYNKSFEYPPERFQEKCLCELSYPKETQTIKYQKKAPKPEQEKEDPYKDLGKCPFENRSNSGDGSTVINNESCRNLNDQSSCIQNKYENNLDQWNGQLVRDSSKDNEGVLMPPRRVHLCTRTITKNKYRTTETDKFKKDLFDSAYNQGFLLGIKFKDYNDEGHEALKNSFYDYGDIIEGEDMMETTKYTNIKEKLGKLLGGARNQGQPNTKAEQPKNVNEWWTTNKTKVWHAMLCGYHQGINGSQTLGGRRGTQAQRMTAPTSSPTTTNIPSNWCTVPSDDSTHQFLRWLREWGTQYCKEKQQLKSDIQVKCKWHLDKYGIIENRNDILPNCLEQLKKYEVWSNNRLSEFERLSKKFKKDKDNNKYSNVKETSAENYLKKNCSECKCSFKDIEQTHKKSEKGGYDIYADILHKAQIPSFLEDTAYRYKGLHPECPNDIECNKYQNIGCVGLVHDDDKDWSSSFVKNNNTTNIGVLLPPRRRHLCLRIYQDKFDHLRNDIKKFKNFICSSAFAEAKRLKKVYKEDNNKLLQAMKYSFADIGNIVKGDDMMEGTVSDNIDKIFKGKQYNETNRRKWWKENKYDVWESMICGYKKAGGEKVVADELLKKNENCRFPDTDAIPQFLRWFQEWTENFCTRRNEFYNMVKDKCKSARCYTKNGTISLDTCKKSCEEYSDYISKKKHEYHSLKEEYVNNYKKRNLDNKEVKDYFKKKCSHNKCDCLYKNFTDDNKWNDPYDTFDDNNFKGKCDCKISETKKPAEEPSMPPAQTQAGVPPSDAGAGSQDKDVSQEPRAQEGSDGEAPEEDSRSTQATSPTEAEGAQPPPEGPHGESQTEAIDQAPNEVTDEDTDQSVSGVLSTEASLQDPEKASTPGSMIHDTQEAESAEGTTEEETQELPSASHDLEASAQSSADAKVQGKKVEKTLGPSVDGNPSSASVTYTILPAPTFSPHGTGSEDKGRRVPGKEGKAGISGITASDPWNQLKENVLSSVAAAGVLGAYGTIGAITTAEKIVKPITKVAATILQGTVGTVISAIKGGTSQTDKNGPGEPAVAAGDSSVHSDPDATLGVVQSASSFHPPPPSGTSVDGDSSSIASTGDQNHGIRRSPGSSDTGGTVSHPLASLQPQDTNTSAQQTQPTPRHGDVLSKVRGALEVGGLPPHVPQSQSEVSSASDIYPFQVITYATLPVRIGFLLGSAAFLSLYLKKKPKLRPTKFFRVIDIPQNNYDMPITKSSNRYVPYESDGYKGKTYIYMEGEETDDYSYIRDISSSDITSSSESEYEELDINDIYVPSLPKYKTLIELVLEPSKRDTFNTPSGDIFTNKLTDDEWNELKQDFIEKYLTHIGSDIPLNNELPDDNMYMDTQSNILHDSVNEKPFITQIKDRFLDSSHEEVTYNIDWNVPENINRITNIMDDPKYCSNNMYTGTDLINDSLNGNQYIDIYDEMLKRKENELFGTYHTKYTTFNSVSKQTPSDPIINQLDLYHKWMDKHRDICEQWKTKEDMLYKLNEVWNMERKEYLLDIQPSTLDDIHKINDETYNIISTNNIYDHPSQETPLQLLGSTNIIPSYITTEQNNGLRTNISMDTHIDEKNYNNVVTTSIIGDDQVENSYNFG
ncbi:erythrocyte membrane protein 1, PfEMP1, putative [Plasmodium sp. gorilla clade G1]|nr:erythrocyte membrane protein 1, PfEMP1, putative [Plasmodium sp. gorilla clade G1]